MQCAYVYPEPESDASETSRTSATSLITTKTPSAHPFTGEDLRFFQHFLLVSRPHLPFGSEDAWTTVIPAQAHEVSGFPIAMNYYMIETETLS